MILVLMMSLLMWERMMMMECKFNVSNQEDLKNVNCKYHTHEVSANNGQSQFRLAYIFFLYDANNVKLKHNVY